MERRSKILWAIANPDRAPGIIPELVRALYGRHDYTVEPVCVLSREEAEALHALPWRVSAGTDARLAPVRYLTARGSSARARARALAVHARAEEAELIALHRPRVSPGARPPLEGRFLEALVDVAPVPILAIPEDGVYPRQIRRVLYPTAFGRSSRRYFEWVLELAKELGASVRVFHRREYLIFPEGSGRPSPLGAQLQRVSVEAAAKDWMRFAEDSGVPVQLEMGVEGPTAAAILETANARDVDLIALNRRAGRVRSLFFGSKALEVLRCASRPVLIVRASRLQSSKTNPLSPGGSDGQSRASVAPTIAPK